MIFHLCGLAVKVVTPGYFRAFRLTVRRGRTLSDVNREGAPLAVVINETMARRYFQKADPVGQHVPMNRREISLTQPGAGVVPWEIVGVIADTRDPSAVYVTNDQSPTPWANLIVRTSLEPKRLETALRQAVAAANSEQVVTDVRTVDESQVRLDDRRPAAILTRRTIGRGRAPAGSDWHLRRHRPGGHPAAARARHPRGARRDRRV